MKQSKIAITAIASTVVIILASGFLAAQEKQPSQKGEMKSMGDMSMGGMMKGSSK